MKAFRLLVLILIIINTNAYAGEESVYNDLEDELTDLFNQHCTLPYELITKTVIALCSEWEGRSDDLYLIENAKKLLIRSDILKAQDFADVQIRWCPLAEAHGIAPDRGKIYLDISAKRENLIRIASLLAHEMKHIQQYRRMGTERFKCEYSKQYLGCGNCQDEHHPLEKEAYDFQKKVQQILTGNVKSGR